MRWKRGQQSDDVIDRRGRSGGLGGMPIGAKAGLPAIIAIVVAVLLGGGLGGGDGGSGFDIPDLGETLENLGGAPAASGDESITEGAGGTADDELEDFMRFVVDDVQATWATIFEQSGRQYEDTQLVLFVDGTETGGCGFAPSQVGPFYCPADRTAYIDFSFFQELAQRFDAPGDFAQAYVIAHEIGHHVQNVLGTSDEVRRLQQEDPSDANGYSVRLELQADCYAGVWAHSTYERGNLEDSEEIEEGITAAEAIGDDALQEQAGLDINPETWTHGSADQRVEWFRNGFENGDPADCDTFSDDL